MNQSSRRCHEVEGAPSLLVDAFKTHRSRTADPRCAFVLTHYHGDHYSGLPRDFKYEGPARIHCTRITAELLREVHGVAEELVVGHGYGETWTVPLGTVEDGEDGGGGPATDPTKGGAESTTTAESVAEVTFLDANHCPGAALVFVRLPDGRCHLHTGDMRYCPSMQEYPPLREAALNRTLDVLYLDTTYGHPKHDFAAQEEAVDAIASKAEELLRLREGNASSEVGGSVRGEGEEEAAAAAPPPAAEEDKTLILLSCYSIGKEKVLFEVSRRTGMPIYANERKGKMLRCVQIGHGGDADADGGTVAEGRHCSIMDHITDDPARSDIHIIPMGTAGELWPFFQPNYNACAEYAQNQRYKRYGRVVAFVPTGWADGSNWNRKNAVSRRRVDMSKIRRGALVGGGEGGQNEVDDYKGKVEGEDDGSLRFVEVEIRLVAYSEHSTFAELRSLVQFLRPRQVVPTVFSDEKNYAALEKRFKDLVDGRRAKLAFFNSMMKKKKSADEDRSSTKGGPMFSSAAPTGPSQSMDEPRSKEISDGQERDGNGDSSGRQPLPVKCTPQKSRADDAQVLEIGSSSDDDDGEEEASAPAGKRRRTSDGDRNNGGSNDENRGGDDDGGDIEERLSVLATMGFDRSACRSALERSGGNVERAVEDLLRRPSSSRGGGASIFAAAAARSRRGSAATTGVGRSPPAAAAALGKGGASETRTITHFFSPRKGK